MVRRGARAGPRRRRFEGGAAVKVHGAARGAAGGAASIRAASNTGTATLDIEQQLRTLVDDSLGLHGRAAGFTAATPLLGAVPELDSMGVVALIGALEERLGIAVEDDEIDGSVFETWGNLLAFVRSKL